MHLEEDAKVLYIFLEKGLQIWPIHPWMYTANYYKVYKERRAQLVCNLSRSKINLS